MSTTWFHKPENALKRANELIAIGNQAGALELLHSVFAARRYKTWQRAYEVLMIKYLDLCVDLQKHREAKDGLHQYRNMTQAQAPHSLETIIEHLLTTSEARATNAKLRATAIGAEEVTQIGDLEAEASPESIMLSTMTEEGGRERTDREVVVPWLKFLWEAYRAVLDILKTNTKLEHVYHNTCIKAFNFCKVYARTTEFRRLCETLRQHISNLQKHGGAQAATKLRGWEGWTNEGIELHLQTRFAQLEVAAVLELWTEGFRTVEDIYHIMQISKKVPKARLMANYYDKLTRIFLVSDNHLFHAYAWYKYYTLSREYNKNLTAEERTTQACSVLLAALAIPEVKRKAADGAIYDEDDLSKEKNQRMATLLGFNTDPSRQNLLQELVARGLLAQVPQQLRQLYSQLEVSSSPLTIVKLTAPTFEYLASQPALKVYCAPLERVVVLRLLEGLSSIYQTVALAKFKSYLVGLSMPFQDVEKLLVRAVKNRDMQVSVDYQAQCLRFTADVMETEGMRTQLTSLARQLNSVVQLIAPTSKSSKSFVGTQAERKAFFAKVAARVNAEHAIALGRKEIIEKRKEETERREQEKAREAARIKAEEEARRREDEANRLAREASLRDREKKQRIEDELALKETKEVLSKLGKNIENLENMDKAERENVIKSVKSEILTEKEKEEKRLRDQAKRLDYIARAMRMEELPVLKRKFDEQLKIDEADFAKKAQVAAVQHKEEWELAIKMKADLSKMQAHRAAFEEKLLAGKKIDYEKELKRLEAAAREQARRAKIDRAAKRKEEHDAEMEAEAQAERDAQEAADRAEREAEEAEHRAAEEAARREQADLENAEFAKQVAHHAQTNGHIEQDPGGWVAADKSGRIAEVAPARGFPGAAGAAAGADGERGPPTTFGRDHNQTDAPFSRDGGAPPMRGGDDRPVGRSDTGEKWTRGGGSAAPPLRTGFGARSGGDGFDRADGPPRGAGGGFSDRGPPLRSGGFGAGGERAGGGFRGGMGDRPPVAPSQADSAPTWRRGQVSSGERPVRWGKGRSLADLAGETAGSSKPQPDQE